MSLVIFTCVVGLIIAYIFNPSVSAESVDVNLNLELFAIVLTTALVDFDPRYIL